MAAFWPGPLTLILPRRADVAAGAAGGQHSIGLRCPSHPAAQALLSALRETSANQAPVWGIAAPSANRFGRISPTTAAHVQSELGDALLVLDGGPCAVGIESTIVDCTRGVPVLLRPGAITRAQVEQVFDSALLSNEELFAQEQQTLQAPKASGTLESHYAPNATLRLMDAKALQTALELLAGVVPTAACYTIAVYARSPLKKVPTQILLRRMPADADAVAQQLFAALRSFDDSGVKLIWVETPPDTPPWEGVRDRLQRASA
jgi:L-threonylcarbamoyladenylate synthase